MAKISESACKAQLRHQDRQDVVIYYLLLIHVLPNSVLGRVVTINNSTDSAYHAIFNNIQNLIIDSRMHLHN